MNPDNSMAKRLPLALFLAVLVMLGTRFFFPPPQAEAPTPAPAPAPRVAPRVAAPPAAPPAAFAPREVVVSSPLYRYSFSTRGGAVTGVELLRFASYVEPGKRVQLVPRASRDVLAHRIVAGGDTIDLRGLEFRPSAAGLDLPAGSGPGKLSFTAAGPNGVGVVVEYTFRPDDYKVDVRGRVSGAPAGASLMTELGTGLAPHDAPEHASERELSVVGWDSESTTSLPLRDVETTDTIAGPLRWAGVKDRYFLLATIAGGGSGYTSVITRHVPDERYRAGGKARVAPRARSATTLPLGADGSFAFDAYMGPLEHNRLVAVGHQLDEVNPYGYRWLRPIVRPIAGVVLWTLGWLHGLGLSYGWVLVLFGFLVRAVTWPLNAKAMRAQMKNMVAQPVLQARMKEIQARHSDDPREQQRAMAEMYKELGVNPLSMLSGCLPMLIPFPVLITLFFVFQSAIEFRGTSFGWLPDLSLQDPFYILPVFLIVSMFALQWVSTHLSGMEQTPQTKMMMYTMPLMMGGFFLFMPSGLNLYYASTNVASLPQQILIALERRRATEVAKEEEAAKAKAAKSAARAQARRR
jgi:YidC/Oxa1 family membrane protein insertase